MASIPPEPPPPPPTGPSAPEPEPVEPPPDVCPHCGSPHEPLQEYCLECGRRLLSPYAVRTTIWSRESPIWLWAALAALLLVALVAGAVAAIAAAGGDDEQAGEKDSVPVVSSSPTGTDTVGVITDAGTITIQPPSTSTLQTTTFTPTTTTSTGTTTTTATGSNVTWPPGKDGYTVVLKSTPTSQGRGPANAAADEARRRGLPQVGILNSSDYTSLRPGYYVTFSGVYDTLAQARAALPVIRNNGFPLAYVREVAD
jgi:hypothetical protein